MGEAEAFSKSLKSPGCAASVNWNSHLIVQLAHVAGYSVANVNYGGIVSAQRLKKQMWKNLKYIISTLLGRFVF